MSPRPDPYKEAANTLFNTHPSQWNRYHWILVVPLTLFVLGSCYGILTAKPRSCDDIRSELKKLEDQQFAIISKGYRSSDDEDKYKSLQIKIDSLKFEQQDKKCP